MLSDFELLAHRALDSAAVDVARTGSCDAVLRRSETTRFSSASDDKVGGFPARSAASGSEQSNRGKGASACFSSVRRARDFRRSQLRVAEQVLDVVGC